MAAACVLYKWPEHWNLPSLSPACIQAEVGTGHAITAWRLRHVLANTRCWEAHEMQGALLRPTPLSLVYARGTRACRRTSASLRRK
jgi:hypothetical protein